ncbi:pyruvate, phosphate dikinase [Tanacetum coccineum]
MPNRSLFQILKVHFLLQISGFPVTIRLLDPPLHEFLPGSDLEQIVGELTKDTGMTKDEIYSRIEKLSEVNPKLGFRGCIRANLKLSREADVRPLGAEVKPFEADVRPLGVEATDNDNVDGVYVAERKAQNSQVETDSFPDIFSLGESVLLNVSFNRNSIRLLAHPARLIRIHELLR